MGGLTVEIVHEQERSARVDHGGLKQLLCLYRLYWSIDLCVCRIIYMQTLNFLNTSANTYACPFLTKNVGML